MPVPSENPVFAYTQLLLFFTTYAMYHVQAAHVLSSQGLDLILMLAVAAGMVWHTLRYRSQ